MHTIEASFIPVCTACGKEFQTGGTQTNPDFKPNGPFDKDNPWERRIQRVFVQVDLCGCWIFKEDAEMNLTNRMNAKIESKNK